jgi:hypothetical protein
MRPKASATRSRTYSTLSPNALISGPTAVRSPIFPSVRSDAPSRGPPVLTSLFQHAQTTLWEILGEALLAVLILTDV